MLTLAGWSRGETCDHFMGGAVEFHEHRARRKRSREHLDDHGEVKSENLEFSEGVRFLIDETLHLDPW